MFSDLALGDILIVAVCMLVSLTFHEAMHAFTAHALGDPTARDQGRLTLNPLKHLDLITTILLPVGLMLVHLPPFFVAKPVPFDPSRVKHDEFGAAMVGLAGPFTNLLLAVIGALILRFNLLPVDAGLIKILVTFVEVNILFFVFNMIPFPPLDGSRLLYAFAPESLQRLMYQIESAGFTTIIFFMLLIFPVISPAITNVESAIFNFLLR